MVRVQKEVVQEVSVVLSKVGLAFALVRVSKVGLGLGYFLWCHFDKEK